MSDLTEIDEVYGDLSREQQFALRGAFAQGEVIESWSRSAWRIADLPTWDENVKYRLQPADTLSKKSFPMEVEAYENIRPDFKPGPHSRRKVPGTATVEMKNGHATRIVWTAD